MRKPRGSAITAGAGNRPYCMRAVFHPSTHSPQTMGFADMLAAPHAHPEATVDKPEQAFKKHLKNRLFSLRIHHKGRGLVQVVVSLYPVPPPRWGRLGGGVDCLIDTLPLPLPSREGMPRNWL